MTSTVLIIIASVALTRSFEQTPTWPNIMPVSAHRTVESKSRKYDAPLTVLIMVKPGVPAYRLECHTGWYDDESVASYSGDYQCVLNALKSGKAVSGNLLASATRDERSTDWWNRGRMLSKQLRDDGPCAGYPEYGAIRHFYMRGMKLTIRFADLVWSAGNRDISRLTNFTIDVSIVPDPTAQTATAAPAPGPRPRRGCYP